MAGRNETGYSSHLPLVEFFGASKVQEHQKNKFKATVIRKSVFRKSTTYICKDKYIKVYNTVQLRGVTQNDLPIHANNTCTTQLLPLPFIFASSRAHYDRCVRSILHDLFGT